MAGGGRPNSPDADRSRGRLPADSPAWARRPHLHTHLCPAAGLGAKFGMGRRNPGMLTRGRAVAQPFKLMHNLEPSCRAQPAVQSSGPEIIELSAAVARKTAGQYASFYDAIETNGVPDS